MRKLVTAVALVIVLPLVPSAQTLNHALGLHASDVRQIQQCLGVMGFDPGPVDGLFGERTSVAFLQWMAHHGLRGADDATIMAHFKRGCQTAIQQQAQVQRSAPQSPQLRYGMTKGDVRNLFGNPASIGGEEPNVYWIYPASADEVYLLQFQHGIFVDAVRTSAMEMRAALERTEQQQVRRPGLWR